jgi:hypothetical protein
MKFRDHPLLECNNGMTLWPPQWWNEYQDKKQWPQGEIGTLEDVWMHELMDRAVFLYVRLNGFQYTGSMYFDDSGSCMAVYNFLKSVVGRSIADIGDFEVSQFSSMISVVSACLSGATLLAGALAAP